MTAIIVQLIILAIVVEAVTEIIVDSELFSPLKQGFKSYIYPVDYPPKNDIRQSLLVFVDKLISCGYCTSVWIAAFFSFFAPVLMESWANWLITTFLLHRMSNSIHVIYELLKKGRVVTHDYIIKINQSEKDEF